MINLILSESNRSYYYLKTILKKKILIKNIILYSKSPKSTYRLIKKKKLDSILTFIKINDINNNKIIKRIKFKKNETNIVSTYPGEIIKNKEILNLNLLHCHSGDLPKFKGSTTIYYSLILENKICVSIFIMNKNIDGGKIVYKKYFKKPKNIQDLEKNFDCKIRARSLIEFLLLKRKRKRNFNKKKLNILQYYIAHPIIRQMVINKRSLV